MPCAAAFRCAPQPIAAALPSPDHPTTVRALGGQRIQRLVLIESHTLAASRPLDDYTVEFPSTMDKGAHQSRELQSNSLTAGPLPGLGSKRWSVASRKFSHEPDRGRRAAALRAGEDGESRRPGLNLHGSSLTQSPHEPYRPLKDWSCRLVPKHCFFTPYLRTKRATKPSTEKARPGSRRVGLLSRTCRPGGGRHRLLTGENASPFLPSFLGFRLLERFLWRLFWRFLG